MYMYVQSINTVEGEICDTKSLVFCTRTDTNTHGQTHGQAHRPTRGYTDTWTPKDCNKKGFHCTTKYNKYLFQMELNAVFYSIPVTSISLCI